MATADSEYNDRIAAPLLRHVKLPTRIATLAGNETWTLQNAQINYLDCGGSGRTITMPASTNDNDGAANSTWIIVNTSDAAEDITVQDGTTTIITISQNEMGIVSCDSTTFDGFIITGALT